MILGIFSASYDSSQAVSELLRCALHDGQASTVTYARVPKSQARMHHQILNYEAVQESFSGGHAERSEASRVLSPLKTVVLNTIL